MSETRPTFFLIAGPNGAGKSTFYEGWLSSRANAPFINADIIQRDELRNPDPAASYEAAKIAEERRQKFLDEGRSFIAETVFSHPSKLELLKAAKTKGFITRVYHVGVADADQSVNRVAFRVSRGGHPVPEDKIRARFARNKALIREAVLLADRGYVFDNSVRGHPPTLGLRYRNGTLREATDNLTDWQRELYLQ